MVERNNHTLWNNQTGLLPILSLSLKTDTETSTALLNLVRPRGGNTPLSS